MAIKLIGEDGYEQGGLIYFHLNGRPMVAIVREREYFDSARKSIVGVQEFINSGLTPAMEKAAKEVERLIPATGPVTTGGH